ncbi:MAG TPA: hypothetical protein VKA30_10580 [Actinomycetota bacterium]|nr:hypothetical protein [Actinomycetota bacterium]
MATASSIADAVSKAVEEAMDAAGELADAARSYLASEQGREIRSRVATAVIVGLPIVSELPGLRRSPLGRALRTAAVGALVIKGAEWLRDWEPSPEPVEP